MPVTNLEPGLATAALEAMPLATAVLDQHGVLIYCNSRWRQYQHAGQIGEPYTKAAEPRITSAVRDVLAGRINQFSLDHEAHDGQHKVYLRTRLTPFQVNGQPALLVTHKNISDFMETERALEQRETQYRAIVEDQTDMICRFKPDTTLTFVNESYCRNMGRSHDELIGHRFIDYVPQDARAEVLDALNRLSPDNPTQAYAHRVELPDGEVAWQHWTDHALFNEQGAVAEFQSVGHDITDLKAAEDARIQSEQRFRELAQAVPEVFWAFDWEQRVIEYVSPAFEQVFGRPLEGLYRDAKVWINCVHPEDRERVNRAFRNVRQKPFEQRYRVCLPDNTTRWVRDHGRAIFNDDGQIVRVVGIAEDITEQVESQERLRRSEDRYRAALEGSLDAFYLLEADRNEQGVITDFVFADVNEKGAALVTRSRKDIIGQRLCELLPINRTGGFFDRYVEVTEKRKPVIDEFSIEAQEEGITATWMQHQVVPVGDGVVITARDISERKAAEQEIAKLYEQTQLILDAVPAYIYYKDAHNRILRVNKAAAESIGLDAAEIEGRPTEDFFPEHAAAYYKDDMEVINSGRPKLGYLESYDADGQQSRTIQTDKVPVYEKNGKPSGIIAIATDVTEKRRGELDRAVLEKAQEERQLIGHELHDGLGQQVTGLRMLLEGCRRKAARGEAINPATIEELARVVSEANSEVRRLIAGLTPDPIAAEELPASLHSIAANLVTFYKVQATADCHDAPPCLTDEQADHLLRIAQEAAHNAAKHANAHEIKIKLRTTDENLELTITDDGKGIQESTNTQPGSGRGMRIMRHRADMIRGHLELCTQKDQGTRVEVVLPLEKP